MPIELSTRDSGTKGGKQQRLVTRVYHWTEDEDEVALDAVTVGISSDTRILKVVGLQFGQRTATICWSDWSSGNKPVLATVDGPMPVKSALQRADQVCELYAFK